MSTKALLRVAKTLDAQQRVLETLVDKMSVLDKRIGVISEGVDSLLADRDLPFVEVEDQKAGVPGPHGDPFRDMTQAEEETLCAFVRLGWQHPEKGGGLIAILFPDGVAPPNFLDIFDVSALPILTKWKLYHFLRSGAPLAEVLSVEERGNVCRRAYKRPASSASADDILLSVATGANALVTRELKRKP